MTPYDLNFQVRLDIFSKAHEILRNQYLDLVKDENVKYPTFDDILLTANKINQFVAKQNFVFDDLNNKNKVQ